jgi:hypothetical protein
VAAVIKSPAFLAPAGHRIERNTPYTGPVFGIKPSTRRVVLIRTIAETEIIMRPTIRISSTTAVAALILVAAASVFAETPAAETTIGNDHCCFTNPRYSGTCEVTTGPDETCADVLAYLNNQASVGKTYCGNTKVRGGWAEIECEGASTRCTPASSAEPSATREGNRP